MTNNGASPFHQRSSTMRQSHSNRIIDSDMTTLSNFKKDKILISLDETSFQRHTSSEELKQLNQLASSTFN